MDLEELEFWTAVQGANCRNAVTVSSWNFLAFAWASVIHFSKLRGKFVADLRIAHIRPLSLTHTHTRISNFYLCLKLEAEEKFEMRVCVCERGQICAIRKSATNFPLNLEKQMTETHTNARKLRSSADNNCSFC